tara:strand:+ start:5331 stop:5822 length:492 start_codon:yes stop_codon:yes gene_type:complete
MIKKLLFILLSINIFSDVFAFNIMNLVNKTDKWKIKINNTSKQVYYDWLNKEWYGNNFNIISEGDIYGKNSIRSIKNINQVITNVNYPYKIVYKEYIMPLMYSNKGSINFKNKNNYTEVIWYLNYQTLPLLDEITYKMYDRIITNSLENLKTYSERSKYQKKN